MLRNTLENQLHKMNATFGTPASKKHADLETSGQRVNISPLRSGSPLQADADKLKTLSITISENDGEAAMVTHPGLFSIGNGQVKIIRGLRHTADTFCLQICGLINLDLVWSNIR